MTQETPLLVSSDDGVVTITLNRPHRRNGINKALVDGAIAALERTWDDPASRVVILTGAEGAFCSGMDLLEPIVPDELSFMRRVGHLSNLIHDLPLPVVAKVRGGAIGFGCNLALCCDLVVAGESALFGEIFAERGLGIDGGGSWTVPRLVGLGKAKELMFLAARTSGREAADLGLVNRCVPDVELDDFVAAWASLLARGPRRALSIMKAQLNASFERPFSAAVEAEALGQALSFGSPEAREGLKAFREKRDPDFRSV
jgi:2-(1,2-epoxy-1,2-dihydrophenyl)acetyl-CoA isomerase